MGPSSPTSLSPAPPPSHTKTQLETAAASQQRAFLTLIRNGDCSCRLITAWDSAVQGGSCSVAQCGTVEAAVCGKGHSGGRLKAKAPHSLCASQTGH